MSLDIIMGPMFAGKTSRILSIVSRYSSLGTPVLVVKHASDARYGDDELWKQDGVHSEDDSVCDEALDAGAGGHAHYTSDGTPVGSGRRPPTGIA